MAENKIHLPSGQGGLTRYFEDSKSKIMIAPEIVIAMVVGVMALILILHTFGNTWFGL